MTCRSVLSGALIPATWLSGSLAAKLGNRSAGASVLMAVNPLEWLSMSGLSENGPLQLRLVFRNNVLQQALQVVRRYLTDLLDQFDQKAPHLSERRRFT